MKKIITIVGARPQFVKAAVVSREIRRQETIEEVIVHTGQHFDHNMSDIFFEQMQIPKPHYNLNIHGLNHGAMTGQMLQGIEEIILKEQPEYVLVYGDTNSTLAGALAAKKLKVKVAHVEAGLRSFNMDMPEEINRILTDRISDIVFCPTDHAIANLQKEGFANFNCKIVRTGDVMFDAAMFYKQWAVSPQTKLPSRYALLTLHRAENTDNKAILTEILSAVNEIAKKLPIVFPLHPRTRKIIADLEISLSSNVIITEPLSYFEILYVLENCEKVMTDSGGLQKEAFFFKKPCYTLRQETEWMELVEEGCNFICGHEKAKIVDAVLSTISPNFEKMLYGDGNAGRVIVKELCS